MWLLIIWIVCTIVVLYMQIDYFRQFGDVDEEDLFLFVLFSLFGPITLLGFLIYRLTEFDFKIKRKEKTKKKPKNSKKKKKLTLEEEIVIQEELLSKLKNLYESK